MALSRKLITLYSTLEREKGEKRDCPLMSGVEEVAYEAENNWVKKCPRTDSIFIYECYSYDAEERG